jgi:hypothetical protein
VGDQFHHRRNSPTGESELLEQGRQRRRHRDIPRHLYQRPAIEQFTTPGGASLTKTVQQGAASRGGEQIDELARV